MGKTRTLIRFARDGVSRLNRSYVSRYPNVRLGRYRPLLHWLFIGILKGNKYFPKIRTFIDGSSIGVRFGGSAPTPTTEPQTPPEQSRIPKYVLDFVYDFSRYEPAVLSPGRSTLPWLSIVEPSNLKFSTGYEMSTIDRLQKPQTVVLVPHFVIGGADQYTSNLVKGLKSLGMGPVQVIATLPNAEFNEKKLSKEILSAYTNTDVVLWKDIAGHDCESPYKLALYLHGMGPKRIINIQSNLGFKAFTDYGKGLSSSIQLFATYFTMDVSAFAGLYGVRYFRKLSKTITSITDNETTASQLRELDNDSQIVVMPTEVSLMSHPSRKYLFGNNQEQKFLWISRLDPFKGTRVLGLIADIMPNIKIDVFGPFEGKSLSELGIDKENITYGGVIDSIQAYNFSSYDGFLFTSRFEGNPLIVLEMAAVGLPIISTNVGDLPREFPDGEVLFVNREGSEREQAEQFATHIKSLKTASVSDLEERIQKAQHKISVLHSEEKNLERIRKVFANES